MRQNLILFIVLVLTASSFFSCSSNPENIAELTAPMVYSLVKNAISQNKYKGELKINIKYENLKMQNSGWPFGEVQFDVEMSEYPGKHVLVHYILDGTHNATALVQIPGKDKMQVKVNLYESAIVFGQAQTVENTIKEISDKLSKKINTSKKVAIFDFVTVNGQTLLLGKRISESMITYLNDNNITIVERKLLDQVLSEASLNSSGLTIEDTMKKMGKLLGADIIVVGTVKIEKEEVIINARSINLNGGEIVSSAQGIVPKYLISNSDLIVR
ncbi:MAG: curli production assembly/transport component CsgG domain protein [Spirochaetes bacterium]|nr:curli production assembly/transport component CsgG domain protein [Spirochaetota bacterium]